MRTPAIAAALAAAALVVPATAAAKGLKEGSVCGASGCRTVTDRGLLEALVDGGPPVRSVPRAGDFYEVTVVIGADGHEESFTTSMVPSRDALRGEDGTWMRLPAAAKDALRSAAGDLAPLPASELTGAAPPPAVATAPPAAPEAGGLSWFERVLLGTPILIAAGLLGVRNCRRRALRVARSLPAVTRTR